MMFSIAIGLFFIAGLMNGLMDAIKHRWWDSRLAEIRNPFLFRFFHQESWRNKYTNGWQVGAKEFERNSTPLFLTDAWHLAKSIMLWSIALGCGLCFSYCAMDNITIVVLVAIILRASFGAGFSIVYYNI